MFSLTRHCVRRGNAERDAHRWLGAQRAYARALRLTPGLAPIWMQYGHALKEAGAVADALLAYRRSDELEPNLADTHRQIGHALELLGHSDLARDHIARSAALASQTPRECQPGPPAPGGMPVALRLLALGTADPHAESYAARMAAAALTTELQVVAQMLRAEIGAVAQATQATQADCMGPVTIEQLRDLSYAELERRFRRQAQFWGMADHVGLCRTIAGRLIFVDTRDFALSPHLMVTGFWELWITRAMARVVRPGMVVADVGANLGYYTVLMAEAVGPTGRVLAFEPNPAIAELLQRTVAVNGHGATTNVDARAASDVSGQDVRFHMPAGQPMNATMVAADQGGPDWVRATTVALDDVLPARVDFLKIDVEGAEYLVWRGLTRTIAANPGIKIFLEVNAGRMPTVISAFLHEIQAAGFALAYVGADSEIRPCDEAFIVAQAPHDVILMLARPLAL